MLKKIKVLIVDDHPIVRDGLKLALAKSMAGIDVVGEAADGSEALDMAQRCPSDVYILDITMPNVNGFEAATEILKNQPSAGIIFLSIHDTMPFLQKALECGARGYLIKEGATKEIIQAVQEVARGGYYLTPHISRVIAENILGKKKAVGARRDGKRSGLTRREMQVLQMTAEGLDGRQIAEKLRLSLNTVRVHRSNLMGKLGLHKQTELIRYALRHGIARL